MYGRSKLVRAMDATMFVRKIFLMPCPAEFISQNIKNILIFYQLWDYNKTAYLLTTQQQKYTNNCHETYSYIFKRF